MDIKIHLTNGMEFTASSVEGYTGKTFAEQLNNPQIQYINIGDLVLNRNAILMIMPAGVEKN